MIRRVVTMLSGLLLSGVCTGCGDARDKLVRVRTEKEANEILVALAEFDLRKAPEKVGREELWQITVQRGDFANALAGLVQKNLPRAEYGGFQSMLDSSGLIPTRTDERAKLMFARAQELEQTLELLDGVLNARVHIAIPEKDRYLTAFQAPSSSAAGSGPAADASGTTSDRVAQAKAGDDQPTASVMLRHLPDTTVQVAEVQRLVANAVEGLLPDRVTVMMVSAVLESATPARPAQIDPPPLGDVERSGLASENQRLTKEVDRLEKASAQAKKTLLAAVASAVVLAALLIFSLIKHLRR